MGHKTHPLGFRLGIVQEDRSLWYSGTNSYISFLKEDYKIREYIYQFLLLNKVGYSGITKLIIKRDETKKRIYIENTEASILVDVLVKKLEERVSFRMCIREILKRYRTEDELKGIKVQIAGRLNGAEIARTEWVREGRVPLQTLRANIDYSYKT